MKYMLLSLAFGIASATIASFDLAVPTPGAKCTGETAYCAGANTNIILRCDDGEIVPGNCNDNEGEPTQGAVCTSFAANTATCSIIGSSETATSSSDLATSTVSIPLPNASCAGDVQYCAGIDTNIILRCEDGEIIPGNCNDNTGEPIQGALCNSYAPSKATCSIIGSSSNMTTSVILGTAGIGTATIGTATTGPMTTSPISPPGPYSNVTHSMASPSVPIQTGAAAVNALSWVDTIMAIVVAGAGLGL